MINKILPVLVTLFVYLVSSKLKPTVGRKGGRYRLQMLLYLMNIESLFRFSAKIFAYASNSFNSLDYIDNFNINEFIPIYNDFVLWLKQRETEKVTNKENEK